jgi:hypothetical protein
VTLSDIFDSIEKELTNLCLKDRLGESINGLEAVGIVRKTDPAAWTNAEDNLERGDITSEQYQQQILKIIECFRSRRMVRRLDKILSKPI